MWTATRGPAFADHEELVVRKGRRSGVYTIVAVHSTTLGPALGGCRMWRYESSADAARDALRLSRAMTFKAAAAGLDLGGGKAVISLPTRAAADAARQRRAVLRGLRRHGRRARGRLRDRRGRRARARAT